MLYILKSVYILKKRNFMTYTSFKPSFGNFTPNVLEVENNKEKSRNIYSCL